MSTTEINPLRDYMVHQAIIAHPDAPLTIEALAPHLPPDFDLGEDDLQPYQQAAVSESAPEVAPVKVGNRVLDAEAAARHAAEAEAEAAEPAAPLPPDPDAIDAAVKRRIAADQALANKRVALLAAQSAERDARAALAQAVQQFQVGFPPKSQSELLREHAQEQAAIRAAIKSGALPPRKNPGIGKSVVDRLASYGRGGNPASGDYRRGAFGSQMRGRLNHDPRRGPVAVVKPPSV